MTTFKQQLDAAYNKKVVGTLEKTVRAVAIIVDQEVVARTPVDTGRARANWQASLNEPLSSEVAWKDETKKDQSYIPPRDNPALKVTGQYKISDKILITNNLPYIQKLNNGSSTQAAAGFIDAAIQVGKNAIKGAARGKVKGSTL